MMVDEFIEPWQTNHRINLFLIEHISDEGWLSTLSTRGGRGVAGQFAHLHNVRVWHLEKRAKDLSEGLEVFPPKVPPSKDEVVAAMNASAAAVTTFLQDLLEGKPKRRGFKKGPPTTLAYLIAHESHHRGNILLTLKQSGHNIDQPTRYAIWNWDRI